MVHKALIVTCLMDTYGALTSFPNQKVVYYICNFASLVLDLVIVVCDSAWYQDLFVGRFKSNDDFARMANASTPRRLNSILSIAHPRE